MNDQLRKIPNHIAIIMDGNGRWAKEKGKKRIYGHNNAKKAIRESIEFCGELGIKYLSLFTFSTENWNRPYSKRLYDLIQANIDKVNFDIEIYEKSLTEDQKKYRDLMQKENKNGN